MRIRHRTCVATLLTAAFLAPSFSATGASTVACLGRLEPGDGVVDVSSGTGERLQSLQVAEGQFVSRGDALAVMDSHAERLAMRDASRQTVEEMRLRVRRNRELTPLEIEASEAAVRRLEAELVMARADLERLAKLHAEELVQEQAYDHQAAETRQVEEQLAEMRVRLRKLRREQEIDLLESTARLRRAEADLASAEARLEQSTLRAPIDGQVLKIFTWPGERVDGEPVLRMGNTRAMYAVAEVYETDVGRVKVGQGAVVRSPALPGELAGVVERVGRMIYKNDVLDIDPVAETDARVVEVRVRLEDSESAARYVHLQVDVEIVVNEGGSPP